MAKGEDLPGFYLYFSGYMKLLVSILMLLFIFSTGCRKKENSQEQPIEQPVTPATPADTPTLKCADLPPVPVPFGWTDTTADPGKNVKSFFFNPLNADEVIAVVEGDAFAYNQMINVNLRTKVRTNLAALDNFLPSINAKGWIVYSTADNNIFTIKTNGDSLRQLTTSNITHDPKWESSGNYFYFLQDAYLNVPAQLIKADHNGTAVFSLPQVSPLCISLRKSEKIILQKAGATRITLVMKDLTSQVETELLSGPFTPGGKPFFNNLTVDQNDENLFWSNEGGIFKWNFVSQKTDTVFKNCGTLIYDCPVISHKINEMTFSVHTIKPINTYFLLHEFRAMELNTLTMEKREIRIFN